MIIPSIGRVVWYYPPGHPPGEQPWPALICFVHNERLINLGGFKADGTPFDARKVVLVQEGDSLAHDDAYASWMPYQQQVAKAAGDSVPKSIIPLTPKV